LTRVVHGPGQVSPNPQHNQLEIIRKLSHLKLAHFGWVGSWASDSSIGSDQYFVLYYFYFKF